MPNWCENYIEISHDDPKMIEKFVEAFNKKEVANTFRPQPDFTTTPVPEAYPEISASFEKDPVKKAEILRNEGTIRKGSWWDWNVINWGTKWDFGCDGQEVEWDGSNNLTVFFLTAWCPPTELFEYMTSEHGFHICGEFLEPGMDFLGRWESDIGYIDSRSVPHNRDELSEIESDYPMMYSSVELQIEWSEEQEEEEREFERKQKETDKAV